MTGPPTTHLTSLSLTHTHIVGKTLEKMWLMVLEPTYLEMWSDMITKGGRDKQEMVRPCSGRNITVSNITNEIPDRDILRCRTPFLSLFQLT